MNLALHVIPLYTVPYHIRLAFLRIPVLSGVSAELFGNRSQSQPPPLPNTAQTHVPTISINIFTNLPVSVYLFEPILLDKICDNISLNSAHLSHILINVRKSLLLADIYVCVCCVFSKFVCARSPRARAARIVYYKFMAVISHLSFALRSHNRPVNMRFLIVNLLKAFSRFVSSCLNWIPFIMWIVNHDCFHLFLVLFFFFCFRLPISHSTDTDIKMMICCQMPTHSHYRHIASNVIIPIARK